MGGVFYGFVSSRDRILRLQGWRRAAPTARGEKEKEIPSVQGNERSWSHRIYSQTTERAATERIQPIWESFGGVGAAGLDVLTFE